MAHKQYLAKLKIHVCSDTAISFLCIYSTECLLQPVLQKNTNRERFTAAQHSHLSKGEWINKMWYTHPMTKQFHS